MAISPHFSPLHEEVYEIDFSDCGTSGTLSWDGLCRIAQRVAVKHSILGALSFLDLQTIKQAWVLNKMRLEIKQIPKWQDVIQIKTWIESLDGIRTMRNFEISLNNECIIGISTLWVIINTDRRRPEPLQLAHDHFTKFTGLTVMDHSFKPISLQIPYQFLHQGRVLYSDLDMVQHVTNSQYIQWILNALYEHNIPFPDAKEIDMVFQKELLEATDYQIYWHQDKSDYHFKIESTLGVHFLCSLR